MRRVFSLLFSLLLVFTYGCEKDLRVYLKEAVQERIVINGLLVASHPASLTISSTASRAKYHKAKWDARFLLQEAEVAFWVNDRLLERRHLHASEGAENAIGETPFIKYLGQEVLREGDRVHIEVSAKGYEGVQVDLQIPRLPRVEVKGQTLYRYDDPKSSEVGDGLWVQDGNMVVYELAYDLDPSLPSSPLGVSVQKGEKVLPLYLRLGEIFPKKMHELFYRSYSSLDHRYMIPTFSTASLSPGEHRVRIGIPEGYLSSGGRLSFHAVSPEYHQLASRNYFFEVDLGSEAIHIEVDEETGMTEPVLSLTNVKGGAGLVLARASREVMLLPPSH